jgi:hypothetical protein
MIACDGSQSSLFKLSKLSLTNCIFRIKEDPAGEDEEMYGLLIMQPSSGDSCVAIYQHPNYLASSLITNQHTGRIHLQVYNTVENQVIETLPIELYPPPLLMIHGLWSSGDEAFFKMKYNFVITQKIYNSNEITVVNYPNDVPLASNMNQIINEFKIAIYNYNDRGISCGKADVVAHCMGGVLTRLYLQNPRYNHDINKLITLNTPHWGSQMANFVLSTDTKSQVIRDALAAIGKITENGAVADLRVNSNPIRNDLNGSTVNINVAPSHTIRTKGTYSLLSWTMLGQLIKPNPYTLIGGILLRAAGQIYINQVIFGSSDNDLYVADSSQSAVLTGSRTTFFDDQTHSSTENTAIRERVKYLLGKSNVSTTFFDMEGFEPQPSNYGLMPTPPPGKTSQTNPLVTIISPPDGSIVNPLDTISISVTGSNGVTSLMVTAGNPILPAQTAYYDAVSQIFSYVVPAEAVGKVGIAVMGFDQDGNIALDSTYIIVQPDAILDSITVAPDTIRLSVFDQTLPVVNGHYNDSIARNLSVHPQLFRHLSTGNAALSGSNTLFGMHQGVDTLTVDFQGKTRKAVIYISAPDSGSAVVPGSLTISGTRGAGSPSVCYNASQTLTVAGSNTTYLISSGDTVSFIAGQKVRFLAGFKASSGSRMSAKITATGQYCSITSAFLPDNFAGLTGNGNSSGGTAMTDPLTHTSVFQNRGGSFSLFPNPTDGWIRISRLNPPERHETRVEIFTLQGAMIQRETWKNEPVYNYSLQSLPDGIYLIRLISGDAAGVFRVVKQ